MNELPIIWEPTPITPEQEQEIFDVLFNANRRAMLRRLADGRRYRTKELAGAARCAMPLASAHLRTLLKAKLVVKEAGLYRMPDGLQPQPGVLRLGPVLWRVV